MKTIELRDLSGVDVDYIKETTDIQLNIRIFDEILKKEIKPIVVMLDYPQSYNEFLIYMDMGVENFIKNKENKFFSLNIVVYKKNKFYKRNKFIQIIFNLKELKETYRKLKEL